MTSFAIIFCPKFKKKIQIKTCVLWKWICEKYEEVYASLQQLTKTLEQRGTISSHIRGCLVFLKLDISIDFFNSRRHVVMRNKFLFLVVEIWYFYLLYTAYYYHHISTNYSAKLNEKLTSHLVIPYILYKEKYLKRSYAIHGHFKLHIYLMNWSVEKKLAFQLANRVRSKKSNVEAFFYGTSCN